MGIISPDPGSKILPDITYGGDLSKPWTLPLSAAPKVPQKQNANSQYIRQLPNFHSQVAKNAIKDAATRRLNNVYNKANPEDNKPSQKVYNSKVA